MTEDERIFFNFICHFDCYESEIGLFFHLQTFLVNNFLAEDLAVLTTAANSSRDGFRWRPFWKGKNDFKFYDYLPKGPLDKHSSYQKGRFFYSFYLEKYGPQEKYFVFSSKKELGGKMISHLGIFLKTAYKNIKKFRLINDPRDLGFLDDVTGLYNQRKLGRDLDQSIFNFENYDIHFSVFFIDVDRFKKINDKYGHITGTKLLLHMANLLKEELRETDLIYRYGGDEFVVIVPDISPEAAHGIGKRILNSVKAQRFRTIGRREGQDSFNISVSIGIAQFPRDAKAKEDILDMADKMMYKAKKRGRGRICRAGELIAEGP